MSIFSKLFGDESSKFLKNTEEIVAKMNALEANISKLADADFAKKTAEFKQRVARTETSSSVAYAAVLS